METQSNKPVERQTINNLPKFLNPPPPPKSKIYDDQELAVNIGKYIVSCDPAVEGADHSVEYCQVGETWFENIYQLREYINYTSEDRYLKDALQTTIDKGYHLNDGNLWEFIYNPCRYESAPMTLSIHRAKEGAEAAMQAHKDQVKAEFNDMYHNSEYPVDMVVDMEWDDNQYWDIKPIKIEE